MKTGNDRLPDLFRELADGRVEALDQIYDIAARDLYGLALCRTRSPADAGDVVQEVFVKLAERRNRLGRVRDPKSYLMTMAYRATVDLHRRRRRRPEASAGEGPILVASSPLGERRLDGVRATSLLEQLPAAQCETVYLHQIVGLSFREIAEITRVPVFTAASRHRLGIERLRRLMGVKK